MLPNLTQKPNFFKDDIKVKPEPPKKIKQKPKTLGSIYNCETPEMKESQKQFSKFMNDLMTKV